MSGPRRPRRRSSPVSASGRTVRPSRSTIPTDMWSSSCDPKVPTSSSRTPPSSDCSPRWPRSTHPPGSPRTRGRSGPPGVKVATLFSARANGPARLELFPETTSEIDTLKVGTWVKESVRSHRPRLLQAPGVRSHRGEWGVLPLPSQGQRQPAAPRLAPRASGPGDRTGGEAVVGGRSSPPPRSARCRGGAVVPASGVSGSAPRRYAPGSSGGRLGRGSPRVPHLCDEHSDRGADGGGGGRTVPMPLVGGAPIQRGQGVVPFGPGNDGQPVSRGVADLDLVAGDVGEPSGPLGALGALPGRGEVPISAPAMVEGVTGRVERIPDSPASAAEEDPSGPRFHRRDGGTAQRTGPGTPTSPDRGSERAGSAKPKTHEGEFA